MLCPRCHVPVTEGQCPSCRVVWDPDYDGDQQEHFSASSTRPISLEMTHSAAKNLSAQDVNWRKELRKKLDEHAKLRTSLPKNSETDTPSLGERESPSEPFPSRSDSPEKSVDSDAAELFEYKLRQAVSGKTESSTQQEEQSTARSPTEILETRLKRQRKSGAPPPSKSKSSSRKPGPSSSKQHLLNLEIEKAEERDEIGTEEAEGLGYDEEISREILLSRLLSGLIDNTICFLLAIGFTLIAASIVDFDFFTVDSYACAALFFFCFYLFNSLFFLITCGQTPGMYATDLLLIAQEKQEPVTKKGVLLRVLLFPPSAVSVLGLAWAIFDPLRRCLHDILSGTRIVES